MTCQTDTLLFEVTSPHAREMSESRKRMTGEVLRVGRRADNDWVFPQHYVSRTQLVIRNVCGLFLLQQIGACPVAINERSRRVEPEGLVAISDGDRVFIDDIEIAVGISSALDDPSESALAQRATCDRSSIAFAADSKVGEPFDLDQILPPRKRSDGSVNTQPVPAKELLSTHWYVDELPVIGEPNENSVAEGVKEREGKLEDVLIGAGVDRSSGTLSAKSARELGALIRICLDSLIVLRSARSQVRNEMHLAETRYPGRQGNAFRTAREGHAAWEALLSELRAEDGSAVTVLSEAFDSIRYHELALLSAHRAAFDHVISTFHPDTVAAGLRTSNAFSMFLDRLQGRLWRRYVKRYRELLSDPDDAYRTLFRERFSRAYEETVGALREIGGRRRQPSVEPV